MDSPSKSTDAPAARTMRIGAGRSSSRASLTAKDAKLALGTIARIDREVRSPF
ncbi:hypothetical protein [Microcoleus sp. Pol12B4]|uniref:hypothetical protein n=1 Tax=Microcoleus sp. Pol12B4 TaxID=3055395 RepID=UPI002FD3FDD0